MLHFFDQEWYAFKNKSLGLKQILTIKNAT